MMNVAVSDRIVEDRGPPNRRKSGAAELERTRATDGPGAVEVIIPSLGETKASGLPAKEHEPVPLGVVDRGVQRAHVAIAAIIMDKRRDPRADRGTRLVGVQRKLCGEKDPRLIRVPHGSNFVVL